MNNATSTPEFKKILQEVYDSGKYRTSGEVLRESWRLWRRDYGSKILHKTMKNPRQKKITVRCKTCGGIQKGPVCLNCLKANSKTRKNPIAIYNPAGKLLPMSVIEIAYKRTVGEHAGQLFKHRFQDRPKVYGLPDGSIIIKGSRRLWGQV